MEGKAMERDRGKSRRKRATSRFKDQLSFGATLLSVAAVAIFIGWLLGQYAIQSVTGPRLASNPLERPASADGGIVSTTDPTAASNTSSVAGGQSSSATNSPPVASGPSAGALSTTPSTTPATATPTSTTATSSSGGFWRVQAGAFSDRSRADAVVSDLHARGFEAVVALGADPVPYRVQVGAFREEARARAIVDDLRAAGFEATVFAPN